MKAFYTDVFVLPLPEAHRFPMAKYRLLRERLSAEALLNPDFNLELALPPAASPAQLLLAHSPDYLLAVQNGTLSPRQIRKIGFPWSVDMVERSRRSSGATIAAARAALTDGFGVNLAGGTHHAFKDGGGGYCVFNDAVIAARSLQTEGLISRALIIDADVHQGDGTAAILATDPSIFTFSIHAEKNYPFRKPPSDLDIGLADDTADADYLAALREGLDHALTASRPDLAIYLAGADPFMGDTLGRLKLSKAGLKARDAMVLEACLGRGVPLAITMAGGYAKDVRDTVDIHFQTVALAAAMLS